MKSFDPDIEDGENFTPLDDDAFTPVATPLSAEAALELLETITHDLAGGGEDRPGQRAMVEAVASALANGQTTIIEAGTGIGKSLAYLIPAALSGAPVVIATATKNLQDQLAQKDAPLVADRLPGVRVAVLKGRQNYICLNRVTAVGGETANLFEDGGPQPKGFTQQLKNVLQWSHVTDVGDRDELTFDVDDRVWRSVSVTPQECLGRANCPQGGSCFAERAKDRAQGASLIIVNSHLYASHLASGSMLLPAHDFVVFDEAHEVRDIFATLLGTSLNAARIRAAVGLAKPLLSDEYEDDLTLLFQSADRFGAALNDQFERGELTGFSEATSLALGECTSLLSRIIEAIKSLEIGDDLDDGRKARVQGPAVHLYGDLVRLSRTGPDELIYLTERGGEIEVNLSLIEVGERLNEELWPHVTGILTSATIPATLPHDLGLDGVPVETFPSPFDYQHNSLLYVPSEFPERTAPDAEAAIIDELVTLIAAAGGRTLALFTNWSVLQRVAEAVAPRLTTEVLVQGTKSRSRIIEEFRDDPAASLFAVTSFWQGIDVPGHSLSLVTIDRLPFAVPTDPLLIARSERSENAFMEVTLPPATMLLAQGVGRLIRSRDDRGVVAVFDTRLATKSYRHAMIAKLPPMRRTRVRSEVVDFLQEIRRHHDEPA